MFIKPDLFSWAILSDVFKQSLAMLSGGWFSRWIQNLRIFVVICNLTDNLPSSFLKPCNFLKSVGKFLFKHLRRINRCTITMTRLLVAMLIMLWLKFTSRFSAEAYKLLSDHILKWLSQGHCGVYPGNDKRLHTVLIWKKNKNKTQTLWSSRNASESLIIVNSL